MTVQETKLWSAGASIRTAVRLAFLIGALVVVHRSSGSLLAELEPSGWGPWTLGSGILLYALALSIPFVPGVELGVGLMLLFGRTGVILVYFGTLLGLSLAFLAGRKLSPEVLVSLFEWLRLTAARDRMQEFIEASPNGLMARVRGVAPGRLGTRFSRHRYLILALAVNVPGNVVVGGGGGIALLAGLSGRFRYGPFLGVCALAVAPVPLLFLLASL